MMLMHILYAHGVFFLIFYILFVPYSFHHRKSHTFNHCTIYDGSEKMNRKNGK